MPNSYSRALEPLTAHFDEARDCVAYIGKTLRLRSSLGKAVNWQLGPTYETGLADSFIKLEPPEVRPLLNGLFVTVVAAFEEFLRTIIATAVRQKAGRCKTFKDMGESFIHRHMEYSGRLLAAVHNPPAHLSIDYYDLCRRLGTCLPDSTKYEVNDAALSNVRGLVELDSFFECLNALGYSVHWDDLARNKELQKLLKTRNTRNTSKELKQAIHETVRNRHKIAHSGQSFADISEDIFVDKLMLLQMTANAIASHLEKQG